MKAIPDAKVSFLASRPTPGLPDRPDQRIEICSDSCDFVRTDDGHNALKLPAHPTRP